MLLFSGKSGSERFHFWTTYSEVGENGPEVYLVERFICNEEVGGSTPPGSTKNAYAFFVLRNVSFEFLSNSSLSYRRRTHSATW